MIRHTRRAVPATLVALVLLAVAVLVAVSGVQILLGSPPLLPFAAITATGAALTTASPVVLGTAGALGVLGLVLVLAAVLPGAATVLPLHRSEFGVDAGVTRRSLSTALAVAAGAVEGIDRADVRVRRGRVRADVRTGRSISDGLEETVRAALAARLSDIAPDPAPQVRVRLATRSS